MPEDAVEGGGTVRRQAGGTGALPGQREPRERGGVWRTRGRQGVPFHVQQRCGHILDVSKALVEAPRTINLFDQRRGDRLASLPMARVPLEDHWLDRPVFHYLGRQLHEVARSTPERL